MSKPFSLLFGVDNSSAVWNLVKQGSMRSLTSYIARDCSRYLDAFASSHWFFYINTRRNPGDLPSRRQLFMSDFSSLDSNVILIDPVAIDKFFTDGAVARYSAL